MKLFGEDEELVVLKLNATEERALAQWTMDLLSKGAWFDHRCGRLYSLVRRIYERKCATGKDLFGQDFLTLIDTVDNWNDRWEQDTWHITDPTFLVSEDGTWRSPPLRDGSGRKYSVEERVQLGRDDTRQIWREIWTKHRRLQGSSDAFLVFPGDDPGDAHAEVHLNREVRFWGEVERLQRKEGLSRSEAKRYAEDYMPRGVLPEGEFSDPTDDPTMLDLLEVDFTDQQ